MNYILHFATMCLVVAVLFLMPTNQKTSVNVLELEEYAELESHNHDNCICVHLKGNIIIKRKTVKKKISNM